MLDTKISLRIKLSYSISPKFSPKSLKELKMFYNESIKTKSDESLIVKMTNRPYLSNHREWFKLKPLHLREQKMEIDLLAFKVIRERNNTYRVLECEYENDDT